MTLSEPARAVLEELADAEPDVAVAMFVPHGLPATVRAFLLDEHARVVTELRNAGHPVKVEVFNKPDGQALALSIQR